MVEVVYRAASRADKSQHVFDQYVKYHRPLKAFKNYEDQKDYPVDFEYKLRFSLLFYMLTFAICLDCFQLVYITSNCMYIAI